jgi:hypothetical protein
MRFLFITRPQFPVPPEQVPALIDGFVAWWDRYRDRWQGVGFFVDSDGGGGVCEVADEAEFHQMILEWPFAQYSKNEGHVLLDMDTALSQWQALLAGSQGGG